MNRVAAPVYAHPRIAHAQARAQARALARREAEREADRQARLTLMAHAVWASTLALAITAAVAVGPASAQSSASVSDRFASWDRDRNDQLSLDEYRAEARAEFDAMDDDSNGNVNAEEMEEVAV